MRVLTLAGHYKKLVDIDICEACTLIWFEGTESIQLAGPGIVDLVHTIHETLERSIGSTLAERLPCPVCTSPLAKVFNLSRFGRTQQWQCSQGHGYFQTFVLYLAEKGFVHKMSWADLKQQIGSKRQLFCAGCGAALDDQPHDACPYCQLAVGVIDPARLASAIDIQEAAAPLAPTSTVVQSKCWSCGGVVDATRESHCSHCHAILKKIDSQSAVAASAAVEDKVRQNYQQQLPNVSSRKLQHAAAQEVRMSAIVNRFDHRRVVTREEILRWLIVLVPVLVLSVWFWVQWQQREPAKPADAPHAATPAVLLAAKAALSPPPVPPKHPSSAAAPVAAAEPDTQLAAGPSFETMFSFPAMECAADATARSAVKVRQIVVVPLAGNSPGATGVDNRSAYMALQQARQELANGTAFPVVLQRYGSAGAVNAKPVSEFIGRGSGKPEVERAAFCLPVQTLSPIFKSAAGFHLLQVVDVR
nr:peptidylprolyl isomerase [Rhodoferax sp.]